jgi:hypothetical protein
LGGRKCLIHHKIILNTEIHNIHVKRCNNCKEPMAVLFGSHARMCLDCIKKRPYPQKHIKLVFLQYSNKTIVTQIKTGEIQRIQVSRTIPQVTRWTIVNKEIE